MKDSKIAIFIICLIFLFSYGVDKQEYEKLKVENDSLKIEVERLSIENDDLKNGESRLIAIIDKEYSKKNYIVVKENIELLNKKHPESAKIIEYNQLLIKIAQEEKIENERKAAEEKERIRLENINNTGGWVVQHYVDNFGEPTNEKYITTKDIIKGTFSNSATQDSSLSVYFLISSSSNVNIMLYEYSGNNPVKAYSKTMYRVNLQDSFGNRYTLRAANYNDRLNFNSDDSMKIHKAFLAGGIVKFRIAEEEYRTTNYSFDVVNTEWYENAYRKLKEK